MLSTILSTAATLGNVSPQSTVDSILDNGPRVVEGPRVTPTARTSAEALERALTQYASNEAVVVGDRTFTFKDIDRLSRQVCEVLAQSGVSSGDRVGLALERDHWLVPIMLAVVRMGAVLLPLD